MTGYELTKAFDRSVNFVWHAVQGQIYPELSRLAAAGLIRQTSTGPRGAKRFEATEEGIAELRRWITDVEPARGIRNETLLRVFFSYLVDPADVESLLRREADEYRRQLTILERFAAERPPETPPNVLADSPSMQVSAPTVRGSSGPKQLSRRFAPGDHRLTRLSSRRASQTGYWLTSASRKRAPPPSASSTSTLPPWLSAICPTIARHGLR